jgi:hypothetical protein
VEWAQTGDGTPPYEILEAARYRALWDKFGLNAIEADSNPIYSRLVRMSELIDLVTDIQRKKK